MTDKSKNKQTDDTVNVGANLLNGTPDNGYDKPQGDGWNKKGDDGKWRKI